jgi:hypothetical protein
MHSKLTDKHPAFHRIKETAFNNFVLQTEQDEHLHRIAAIALCIAAGHAPDEIAKDSDKLLVWLDEQLRNADSA